LARIIGLHAARARRKAAYEVDADHRVPLLVLHPHGEIVAGYAGIVDEDVEPAQLLHSRRDQSIHRCRIGQVARQHDRIGP
jgi:hypothetical protein